MELYGLDDFINKKLLELYDTRNFNQRKKDYNKIKILNWPYFNISKIIK